MHIPQAPTQTLTLQPFDDARRDSEAAPHGYDVRRWIYIPSDYRDYRYLLGTRGRNPLICIGINPSTAAPDDLDNTLKSVQRIALHNGFDSFIMFNVYAQRATNPDDMDRACNAALHRENMNAFRYILASYGTEFTPAIWAGWGNLIEKRPYLCACVQDMIAIGKEYGAAWYHVGSVSVKGHPHHPLYLRKDAVTEPFDIEGYCRQLAAKKK